MERRSFLTVLAEVPRRWLLILTLAAVGAGGAAAFAFTAQKHYSATAEFLVAPVPASDPTYVGLDVLQNSGGTHAAAESAARLVVTPQVAEAVRLRLGTARSAEALRKAAHAEALGDSNVVAVTVEDPDRAKAAQIANGFVDSLIEVRTASFQSELQTAIRKTQLALVALAPNQRLTGQGAELSKRLGTLRALVGTNDPTIRHASLAVVPTSPSWPHPIRLTLLGLAIGLGAGVLLAFLLELFRPSVAPVPAPAGVAYDRVASERLFERLEERLSQRIEELATEFRRLAGREAGLQARERDLAGKLDELRDALPERDEEAERRLEERVAAVTRRERELIKRAGPLAARERELEERERALAAREAALEARADEPAPEPEPQPEPEPEPEPAAVEPEPEPEPPPPPVVVPAGGGARWNLHELERLVEEEGRRYPDKLAEWESYLFFLRDYAGVDGSVPDRFDWLIQDAFQELVA